MKKHLNLILALLAGFVGGSLNRYVTPPAAFAQNQAPVAQEIRGQSFVFVAPDGRTLATLTPDPEWLKIARLIAERPTRKPSSPPSSGRIVLLDSNDREIWSAGGSPFRTPSEH